MITETNPVTEQDFPVLSKIKYWHNTNTGKHRKAGRSKARPNEEEAWLTEEEAAQL
jgi:hypothetical protein